ncbi:PTS sugar transporter subunit IIA [Budviciaceae bacterium BWR-B9]|uniref:PTS sugar transporter subunit IIA n=1 Tax=Limnobaculum allomyrinae TaxID=2791986 RepID=A0ABS1IMK0_9GAMM|nr:MULTISPECIES: PTS sugar transporter subunit IIA [Limnobaculum]MBK5142555.1 PTS sugar transporter subunit IIA [Limnobaculum allomyrinae]MBV7690560.1 PTS sugar transporter subunit IIA [Limnobaculum sp. M2-1]
MIEDCKTTQASRHVESWREAVALAATPLIELGYVKTEYIQGIIDNTLEYGPYYLIAPGIALPHARPQQGALRNGVAFTTLSQPVSFGHDECDPIWLLICVSATDAEQHIKTIQTIVSLLDDSALIAEIQKAKSDNQLYQLLHSATVDI